ncbi:MAG: dephospho-CoA kinase, partial [Verrucomicrobiota bacterium]|nr:dephospho-CoA kinase [Verrucomicrobiota bacterium]
MNPFPGKTVIGLTGGIASGKSTALKIFEQLGWETISVDSIVSEF